MISSVNFEERLDVLLLTKMWQTNHDDVAHAHAVDAVCMPPLYTYIDVPRPYDSSRQYQINYHGSVATDVADRRFTCPAVYVH